LTTRDYYAIGLMSGTSLDGLEILLVRLTEKTVRWEYKMMKASTISYSEGWKKKLTMAGKTDGERLIRLHKEYGR